MANPESLGAALKRYFMGVLIFFAIYLAWKADVIWSYYEFKQLCAAEGGLKIYEKLEKGKGWELTGASNFEQTARVHLALMPNIGFFRVPKASDNPPPAIAPKTLVDVRYLGGPTLPISSYSFQLADQNQPVMYKIVKEVNRENNNRVSHFWFEIRDAKTQKPQLRYTQFIYHWRSIPVWHWFGPSGESGCPAPAPVGNTDFNLINQTAFK